MFSGINTWFSKKFNQFDQAHNQISWEEALDTAIQDISDLKDLDTDKNKNALNDIISRLQIEQNYKNTQDAKIFEVDLQDGDNEAAKSKETGYKPVHVYYDLPWEGLREDMAR